MCCRALRNNLAAQHDSSSVCNAPDNAEVMRDKEIAHAEVILKTLQELENIIGHKLVERRSWFIANNDLRLGRQSTGNTDTLFLSA